MLIAACSVCSMFNLCVVIATCQMSKSSMHSSDNHRFFQVAERLLSHFYFEDLYFQYQRSLVSCYSISCQLTCCKTVLYAWTALVTLWCGFSLCDSLAPHFFSTLPFFSCGSFCWEHFVELILGQWLWCELVIGKVRPIHKCIQARSFSEKDLRIL